MSNDLYNSLSLSILSNSSFFSEINCDPLDLTISNIFSELTFLFQNKYISKKLFNSLIIKDPKLGKFRMLPKLHKSDLSFRPIINCISHPTSNLCLLIDFILQPFVKASPSYIQDSQNFIQKTHKINFPVNSLIYSLDFESLYTNIDLNHALIVISEFMIENIDSTQFNITSFTKILKLIFDNNVFQFNTKFFKQVHGIAMGSKCGPTIANIYVSCLEKNFLTIHKPLAYYRFIDDICIITKNDFDISILINSFNNLSLVISSSVIINFLDLVIYISPIHGHLCYSLYIKKTNTFSYLLQSSNHPLFIFKNIPKSLFYRIRRICTYLSDYYLFSRLLILQLLTRGYKLDVLLKTCNMISKLNRNDIIEYKDKTKDINKNKIYFNLPFNFNYDISKNITSSFNSINSNLSLKNYHFRYINSIQNNNSSLFIHNKPVYNRKYYFKKCNNTACKICLKSNPNSFLNLNNFHLPILSNSSCNSLQVIYIIKCTLCCQYYIGETENFKRRMSVHIKSCNSNQTSSNCKVVFQHFNQVFPYHQFNKDFEFYIFKTGLPLMKRKNLEAQLINLFIKLDLKLINVKIPNLDYFKNFENLFT